jgi:hypothetical protein
MGIRCTMDALAQFASHGSDVTTSVITNRKPSRHTSRDQLIE